MALRSGRQVLSTCGAVQIDPEASHGIVSR
jgi:hypothetical protein